MLKLHPGIHSRPVSFVSAPVWTAIRWSSSPEETFRLGRALGERIAGAGASPRAIALLGELGSGKTVFTKGLAAGAGVRESARVTSPTFVIRQDYQGRLAVHHYDAYRLSGPGEIFDLGFREDLDSGALVVVEWADRVLPAIPPAALRVELEHAAPADASERAALTEPGVRIEGARPPDVPGPPPADGGRRRITFRGDAALWRPLVEASFAAAD